jgi:uncharacterized membrane protein
MEHALYLAASVFVLALIVAGLGVPLMLGKVKRNGIYGFRTFKTMRDDATWYAANRYGGKALIVCGVVMAVLGATLVPLSMLGVSNSMISVLSVAFELAPILLVAAIAFAYDAKIE